MLADLAKAANDTGRTDLALLLTAIALPANPSVFEHLLLYTEVQAVRALLAPLAQTMMSSGKATLSDWDVSRGRAGYASYKFSYDDLGRETKREFFDENGVAVVTRVTLEKVEPGGKSQRIGLQAGDAILSYDGLAVPNNRVFWEQELLKGEQTRELRILRAGKVLSLDVPQGRLTGLETVDKRGSD